MLQKQFIVQQRKATLQNPKYKWRLDRTEGSRYYGNIGRADAPVLQFCCVLVTVCVCCTVTGVEERVRPGVVQVWSIRGAGARDWRVGSCYTFNEPWPGCSVAGRGNTVTGYYRS